ncbi:DUF4031 domain-containing protein [Kocuria sp.]|uniref:DUF4031 domain-containing protein n=1 Tax=Kocuria sp. TaxID=1871328 RepID=UPI0026DAB211|nr:DUF4031 domain-containing protein [Kocuria sp.]MDO4919305.1 DUF4031 domain-containing protein [Kocuria sp.]
MTVYIDPPRWPAHGTVFSHLVSDASLRELHEFAAALGISERAFDRDHYDVPAHRHADAVGLGATAVDGKQLARLLIGSGLRIPARRRPAKLASVLTDRWERHFPWDPETGHDLVARWSEPHRVYHGPAHLLHVLESLDRLTDARARPHLVLAAWFHDAVHEGRAGQDERDSAELARAALGSAAWPEGTGERVAELVLVTAEHSPDPGDREACLLVDADLSVLGGPPEDYERYRQAVRREYASVPEDEFRAARTDVLSALLTKPSLFHDPQAVRLWEERARRNLAREIERLGSH